VQEQELHEEAYHMNQDESEEDDDDGATDSTDSTDDDDCDGNINRIGMSGTACKRSGFRPTAVETRASPRRDTVEQRQFQHRQPHQLRTRSAQSLKSRPVLIEGVPMEEFEEGFRVPAHRRLPDNYPYVLQKIGENIEMPLA
jgi:hypothetical protein